MSQVAAPADRRFRRAHVKPGRRRRWRVLLRYAGITGLLLLIVAFAAYRGSEVVMHARMLQIDRLVVTGNERVPSAKVLEAVEGLKGQNLVWTNLEAWRGRLLKSPWVRDAALRRSLPSTVEIVVSERLPAIIARVDGRLFLVDDQGIIIDHFGPRYASFDLPLVDGIAVSQPGPGVQADQPRAALAARVVTSLRSNPDVAKRVSQIDVADPYNAHVTLTGDPAVLYLGDESFQQRVESYLQLADRLRETVPDIEYVDLRFGSRVFVGPVRSARGGVSRPQGAAGRARHSSATTEAPLPTRANVVSRAPLAVAPGMEQETVSDSTELSHGRRAAIASTRAGAKRPHAPRR
ncbi:MAG: FtsQ-type POTRA domain-containing protein [Acidimicrobiia bacterium]|nr:FtsQ-type POTRA domain-containing protein [Acidimicrobiia bacterium]